MNSVYNNFIILSLEYNGYILITYRGRKLDNSRVLSQLFDPVCVLKIYLLVAACHDHGWLIVDLIIILTGSLLTYNSFNSKIEDKSVQFCILI